MKWPKQRLTEKELRDLHALRVQAIRARLADFAAVHPDEHFYELAYCLLTPQSSAVNAGMAIRLLRENNFEGSRLDPEPFLHRKEFYIRFHKTKARHLLALRSGFGSIAPRLVNCTRPAELREWLVENVQGLGWKEASHFLRNIGARNLAILDRHILRNLVRAGVIRTLPKTMTKKTYLRIERKFLRFSHTIGIPMDELDLVFWSKETGEILK